MTDLLLLIRSNDRLLIVLLVAIVCDMVTGVIKAIFKHELRSADFRLGMLKKTLDIILVVIGFSIDWMMNTQTVGKAVCMFLVSMEFYSCLENIREYIPLPEVLQNVLEKLYHD